MKISNFAPEWGDLIGGAVGVAADASARHTVMLDLTNQSGSARSFGDVVVIDRTTAESFTTSTTSNTVAYLGVLDEDIGITSNGRVVVEGYARAVNTIGVSAVGDFLYGSTTAAKAAHMGGTIPAVGAFGIVLTGGSNTNSKAYVFPTVQTSTLSAASNTTDVGGGIVVGGTGRYSDGAHVHRGVSSISHTSNTFYGAITFTTPGNTVGITSPSVGTLAFTAPGGTGGSGTATGQGLVDFAFAKRTSGSFTLNSTSWANLDTGLDLTLTAASGEIIEVCISARWGSQALIAGLDVVTLVGGSPVNSISGANGAAGYGVQSWSATSGSEQAVGGAILYTLVSGDISSSTVTLRLRYRTASASNKGLYAESDLPFHWYAKNLGPAL